MVRDAAHRMVTKLSAPIHIWSMEPFQKAAKLYGNKGWNVIPLPARKKKSPPGKDDDPQGLGFTGRSGRLVTEEDIDGWLADEMWGKGNIAVRAGNVVTEDGKDYEVIGIDVDNYEKKTGGAHLKELEVAYGPLPSTWTSSARADSISGIRWFLTPAGYEYSGKPRLPSTGKASDSIEIVQRVHRYGLVFPSMHPEGMQYRWYSRGQSPDGIHSIDTVPLMTEMAVLPDNWWKFLTQGGIAAVDGVPIDMESTNKELNQWAKKNFVAGQGDMCDAMSKALAKHVEDIDNASDHHDPIVRTHWHLFRLGAEGHKGWLDAITVCESAWVERSGSDGSRSPAVQRFELARSRYGALRKIKGEFDEYKAKGVQYLSDIEPCVAGKSNGVTTSASSASGGKVPPVPTLPVDDGTGLPASDNWERNEDGNAEHFLALNGPRVRFVVNHADGVGRWLIFSEKSKRWLVDVKETLIRHQFRRVKKRQQRDAAIALLQAATAVFNAGGTTAATVAQNQALKEARAWVVWANESGNKARVSNSLAQAQSFPGVSLLFEELDRENLLLPVANGIIKFAPRESRLAGAKPFEFIEDLEVVKDLMITQSTGVPYIPFKDQKRHYDKEIRDNYATFVGYMRMFLKDHMSPESFDYVSRILGLSILGVNIKKAVFLVGLRDTGKSTFQNMMSSALGELAIWREPAIFDDTPFKSALAEALSRRVCMVGELGEKHMDASLFKRITGGDEVSCQLKNVNKPVTLRARCTVISGCNSAPEVPNVDDATKERFVVIPFRHQLSREERNPNAQDELMEACKVPLLAFLIDSCAEAIMTGVNEVPDELQLETKNFVAGLSEMSDFLRDWVIQIPAAEWKKYARKDMSDPLDPKPRWPDDLCVGSRKLYEAYVRYTNLNNMKTESSHWFTRRMKEAGLIQDGSKNKDKELRWIGIALSSISRVSMN